MLRKQISLEFFILMILSKKDDNIKVVLRNSIQSRGSYILGSGRFR